MHKPPATGFFQLKQNITDKPLAMHLTCKFLIRYLYQLMASNRIKREQDEVKKSMDIAAL